MSKSRLEKFLYALYSLDSSDLPNPLSRIEELYKCLVTGEEAPTFEPISRVEKYLMAILGVYDMNELPNPISRVEVLLYKLATGDDNLDDVKSFLSEHEELLAGIIGNGGVGGNIEYVLYTLSTEFNTLYNTSEKPVKSAILKGNTKYRDIDTGDILDTFDETKNLELVSVKMPVLKTFGKNLLEPNKISQVKNETVNMHIRNIIKANVDYVITFDNNGVGWGGRSFYLRNSSGDNAGYFAIYDNMGDGRSGVRFRFTEEQVYELNNGGYLQLYNADVPDIESRPFDIQIEESSIATSYEPFKSNILTTSEEVELRGIGDVKDELDLETGKLTQRIGEVVLDGSEGGWILSTSKDNTQVFYLPATNSKIKEVKMNGLIMCDKLKTASGIDDEIINFTSSLYIALLKSKVSTVKELKVYLSQNPITFIHEFVKESVKTVDLSVVDQDGNNTELNTFNDITYVTLSSEGLIPEAELEVATKNKEVLSTMSLEMNDISTTQNALQETSDIQSENVDATMIATTEIYEELL